MPESFTVEWINRIDQLGYTDMDLLIVHDQGVIPPYRVSKNYSGDYDNVNEALLQETAIEEIANLVANWNNENEPEP